MLLQLPQKMAHALLDLLYPRLCLSCGKQLSAAPRGLCVSCRLRLPVSDHFYSPENSFTERFWGRLPLEAGFAFLQFSKGGMVQGLLHQFKYQGKKELGEELGKLFGYRLKEEKLVPDIAGIVPVPLHPKKRRKRGYNQSEWLAKGLGEALEVPVLSRQSFKFFNQKHEHKRRHCWVGKNIGE